MLSDVSEEGILSEIECADGYRMKYALLKGKYLDTAKTEIGLVGDTDQQSCNESISVRRKFRLPNIELKKISEDIKGVTSFLESVYEDLSIDPADKIQYLFQAKLPNSPARHIVESFPAIDQNYENIVKSLKSSFGREDQLIEVYVRELLKLIIMRNGVNK